MRIWMLLIVVPLSLLGSGCDIRPADGRFDLCDRLANVQKAFERAAQNPHAAAQIADPSEFVSRKIADHCVALNEIQVVGTHNSYHVAPIPELLATFVNIEPAALEWESPIARSVSSSRPRGSARLNSMYSPTPMAGSMQIDWPSS